MLRARRTQHACLPPAALLASLSVRPVCGDDRSLSDVARQRGCPPVQQCDTPNSVNNFLAYTNSNRYNGTFIHRVPQSPSGGTSHFVVQGGGFLLNNSIFAASGIVELIARSLMSRSSATCAGSLSYAKNLLGGTSQ